MQCYLKFFKFFSRMGFGLSLIGISMQAQVATASQRVLACLGQEELALHKLKHSDQFFPPYYRLNRLLVNEISGLGDLKLKPKYARQICQGKRPVSEALVRELLLKRADLFEIDKSISIAEAPFVHGAIEELVEKAPYIFFQYLSDLQSQAPTAQCLFEGIPYFKYFIERFHYLEVELTPAGIVAEHAKLLKLYSGLDHLSAIFKACEFKAKQKASSPKKP